MNNWYITGQPFCFYVALVPEEYRNGLNYRLILWANCLVSFHEYSAYRIILGSKVANVLARLSGGMLPRLIGTLSFDIYYDLTTKFSLSCHWVSAVGLIPGEEWRVGDSNRRRDRRRRKGTSGGRLIAAIRIEVWLHICVIGLPCRH